MKLNFLKLKLLGNSINDLDIFEMRVPKNEQYFVRHKSFD